MKVPFLDLQREYFLIKKDIDKAVARIINSGCFILGEEVEAFEEEWARYLKAKNAIGVANGTDALNLAIKALGIGQGDEVIVPSFTFIATAFAVSNAGATPVFADINPSTFNIDPTEIKKKITKKTKAIIPVHLYGNPAEMDAILKIGKENKLYVIEDAAQAHGAKYKDKKIGSIGDIGCFSFYPTKNLGCYGDGGAIVTNNSVLAERIRMLRNEGQKKKYKSEMIGTNSRLDEVQAAILRVKLKHLDEWNEKRRERAAIYKGLFDKFNVQTQEETSNSCSVNHVFPILVKKRDKILKYLKNRGVGALVHYPIPVNLQIPYKNTKRLKVSEKISSQEISLPMFPFLSVKEIEYTVRTVKEIL